jgi:hypothetical protein
MRHYFPIVFVAPTEQKRERFFPRAMAPPNARSAAPLGQAAKGQARKGVGSEWHEAKV